MTTISDGLFVGLCLAEFMPPQQSVDIGNVFNDLEGPAEVNVLSKPPQNASM